MDHDIYRQYILELYRNPLNKKKLDDFDVYAREINSTCGDEIEIFVTFDKQGNIEDIGHQGHGCAISQAAVSLLTDHIKGKSIKEIKNMSDKDMIQMLEIPISHTRFKCAMLGFVALQQAL